MAFTQTVPRDGAPPPDLTAARAVPPEPLVPPESLGVDPRLLARAVKRFRAQQQAGLFPGGQIAVRRHGKLLLDETVGWARGLRAAEGEPLRAAGARTPFPVFSAGKPLVAIAIALLEERGRLDVAAPIREVIPEFGVRGKERITTLDVLTHRGGILMPEFMHRPRDWADWNKVVDAICAVRPSHRRGVLAYHPLEYGWVLAEVVRRVAGRPLPEFLASEFLAPAGLDRLRFGATPAELPAIARPYWFGGDDVYIAGINIGALHERAFAMPEVMTAFVPGGGLVTDAAALSAFYEVLVGGGRGRTGRRVLSERTIARYTERHAMGWCRSNRAPLAVGRGFLLGWPGPSLYGWQDGDHCYGHAGLFCTVAFADKKTGLSAAIITNGNRSPVDLIRRFIPLIGRIRSACNPGWLRI